MLSETPATMASSRGPCAVRTSPTMRAGKRLCIWRGSLSSRTFHNSFMRATVSGLSSVSLRCHDVRSLSYPSVSQFAFACPCAPRVAVDAAPTITAATIPAVFSFIGYLVSSWGRRGARVQLLLRHLRGRREQERLTVPLALSQALELLQHLSLLGDVPELPVGDGQLVMGHVVGRVESNGLLQVRQRPLRLALSHQDTAQPDACFLEIGVLPHGAFEPRRGRIELAGLAMHLAELVCRVRVR